MSAAGEGVVTAEGAGENLIDHQRSVGVNEMVRPVRVVFPARPLAVALRG